jgi:hypothetical protein
MDLMDLEYGLPAAQSMHLLAEAGGLSVERLFLDLWY